MSQPHADRDSILRAALLGNAGFSALTAILSLALGPDLESRLGLGSVAHLRSLGVQLALFAAWLAWMALRRAVPRWQAWVVVGLDGLWVIGSASLLLAPPADLAVSGRWAVAGVALMVAGFAVAQTVGLLAMKRHGAGGSGLADGRRTPLALGALALALACLVRVGGATGAAVEEGVEPLADLRTDALRRAGRSEAAARRGLEILRRTADRHGLQAWRGRRTLEVVATDEWALIEGKQYGHFPERVQRFRMRSLLGTFTSRLELLGGKGRGEIWGIQAWAGYRIGADQRAPTPSNERRIVFYLPTLQYFNELPFRLLSAPIVLDAGDAASGGKEYHRVLVTWGSVQANPDHDQYVLWIDRRSGRIEMTHYTVRDAFPSAQGTIHFEDYRDIQGVWLPFRQTVTVGGPDDARAPLERNFFHRLLVEEARFDAFEAELLRPFPERAETGDRKPGS